MLALILAAAPIFGQASIDRAIDQARILERLTQLELERADMEARLNRIREVADATAECFRESFVIHATDLFTTALAGRYCLECREANPAGFSSEARIAMKLGLLGARSAQCYFDARDGKTSNVVKWSDRVITLGVAAIPNLIATIKGEPIIRWGIDGHKIQ